MAARVKQVTNLYLNKTLRNKISSRELNNINSNVILGSDEILDEILYNPTNNTNSLSKTTIYNEVKEEKKEILRKVYNDVNKKTEQLSTIYDEVKKNKSSKLLNIYDTPNTINYTIKNEVIDTNTVVVNKLGNETISNNDPNENLRNTILNEVIQENIIIDDQNQEL